MIIIAVFLISCAVIMLVRRKNRYGVAVIENGKTLANGKQGTTVTIGRARYNDVRLPEPTVSRAQATVRFQRNGRKSRFILSEWGASVGECTANEYRIAGHRLEVVSPEEAKTSFWGVIPTVLALGFVSLQAVDMFLYIDSPIILIPYFIIAAYLCLAVYLRPDRTPLAEAVFAILLTFYIEATLHPITDGVPVIKCAIEAIIGTFAYTFSAVIASIFLRIDFNKKTGKKHLQLNLRVPAVLGIFVLIALNFILARNVNGAYNWITIGGVSFQPSELVKVLLVFTLVLPEGKASVKNLFFLIGVPAVCMVYGLLIKDIGVLLQFAALTAAAILLQYRTLGSPILLFAAGVFGAYAVLSLSATAASRFTGWLGDGFSLWESLTAAGVIDSVDGYGYQSVHSLVAVFCNGGILGNRNYDVMKDIPAANSDLVTALISQRHGWPTVFFILALYAMLLCITLYNLKQQNKFQQTFACLSVSLIIMAMGMNLAGTFGVLPLTGVVCPAISDGISAAVSYGALFGGCAVSDLPLPIRQRATSQAENCEKTERQR